jgi:predicted aspartyl protease
MRSKSITFTVHELEANSYHPLVSGKINGMAVNLIIDTGASRTVIDTSVAENFKVDSSVEKEAFAAGINAQTLAVNQVVIPKLKLDGSTFKNVTAFSTDLSPISNLYEQISGIKIHGLIGCDFLVTHNARVDFLKRKIFWHKTH